MVDVRHVPLKAWDQGPAFDCEFDTGTGSATFLQRFRMADEDDDEYLLRGRYTAIHGDPSNENYLPRRRKLAERRMVVGVFEKDHSGNLAIKYCK